MPDSGVFVDRDDRCLLMFSAFDNARRSGSICMVGFVERETGLFERFDKDRVQAAFQAADVEEGLRLAGVSILGTFECFGFEAPRHDAQRTLCVCRRASTVTDTDSMATVRERGNRILDSIQGM